jgi:hypothetical protein
MAMNHVFTGKTGLITLLNNGKGTGPEVDDALVVLDSAFGGQSPVIGRATGIHVAVQTDLEEFHEVGHRHPIVLQPGNIHISGTLDRAYISGGLIMLLLGRRALSSGQPEIYAQPAFSIKVDLVDPAVPNNSAELVLDGVKFQNWALRMPEDDFVMENVSFRALTIAVRDKDENAVIEYAFPS